jgi:hypothetical protein
MSNLNPAQFSALVGYTHLGDKTPWKNIAHSLHTGEQPGSPDANTVSNLMSAVKQHGSSERPVSSMSLVAGVNLPKGKRVPKTGESVDHPLTSATSKDSIAEKFALRGEGKPVIFHYPHNVSALDVNKTGADSFADESEHIISGSFEVGDTYKEKNIHHVYLRHKE